ncbi:MAG: lactonase family protein [bacterium]|nr:lactonase family protein [bacterium]
MTTRTLFALTICTALGFAAVAADSTPYEGMIVACEQARPGYVILDPDADWSDPAAVVWEWKAADAPKLKRWEGAWFGNPSDAKPVMGGTHLLVCASGGGVALIRVKDKRLVWYALAGGNTHSIEILPDGNIVSASSTGSYLAVFDTSKPLKDPRKPNPEKITLSSAHGVVWDAKRERLWAIGGEALKRYRYTADSGTPTLVEEASFQLPGYGGHDLFPVAGEDRLYLTSDRIWTFDPEAETFASCLPLGGVKSVSKRDATGSVIFMKATEVWWSDTIRFMDDKRLMTLPGARFYKARWWVPNRFSYPDTQ